MSGGRWDYAQYKIEDLAAEYRVGSKVHILLMAVAKCEHLIDWAEAGDSARANAEPKVYDILRGAFSELWDS